MQTPRPVAVRFLDARPLPARVTHDHSPHPPHAPGRTASDVPPEASARLAAAVGAWAATLTPAGRAAAADLLRAAADVLAPACVAPEPATPPEPSPAPEPARPAQEADPVPASPPAQVPEPPRIGQALTLKLGDTRAVVTAHATAEEAEDVKRGLRLREEQAEREARETLERAKRAEADDDDVSRLDVVPLVRRLRLKARATRWQIERQALFARAEDVADTNRRVKARDAELVALGGDVGTFLWMCRPEHNTKVNDAHAEPLAKSYEAVADAADAYARALATGEGNTIADAVKLLAKSQNMLRQAVSAVATQEDAEQSAVFAHLRHVTFERRIHTLHLKAGERVNPSKAGEVRREVAEFVAKIEAKHERRRADDRAFGQVKYEVAKYLEEDDAGREEEALRRWRSLWTKVQALTTGDTPGTAAVREDDPRLIDALRPLLDARQLPEADDLREASGEEADDLPALASLVLAHAAEAGEAGEAEPAGAVDAEAPVRVSDDLKAARRLLAGRVMVLVGGMPREYRRVAIEKSLGLRELLWLRVQHHQSLDDEIGRDLRREDVEVLAVMTRFRSHRDGPAVREAARQHDRAFFELPGGYSVEQIAYQVMRQAAEKLRSMPPRGRDAA